MLSFSTYYHAFNICSVLDSGVLWNSTETVMREGGYVGLALGKNCQILYFLRNGN